MWNICTTNELSGIGSEDTSYVDIDPELVVHVTDEVTTAVSNKPSDICTELYDSGTTHHISPYRELFENYTSTPPKSLNTTNNGKFVAVGKEDMVIEVGYTLVSIGQLDECGYSTAFGNGQCTISNESGDIIGQVPRSQKAVYKVVHDGPELTCTAEDMVTWTELHHRLGHVLQGVVK